MARTQLERDLWNVYGSKWRADRQTETPHKVNVAQHLRGIEAVTPALKSQILRQMSSPQIRETPQFDETQLPIDPEQEEKIRGGIAKIQAAVDTCYAQALNKEQVLSMWTPENIRHAFFADGYFNLTLMRNFLQSLGNFYAHYGPNNLPAISPQNVQQGIIKARNRYFGYSVR